MKKTLFLTIALLFCASIMAQDEQEVIYIIDEHFDSASMPEGWTTIGPDDYPSDNWSISNTNYAGGEANEAKISWSPQFAGTNRLVSTPVDLTGIQNAVVSMNHYFENYNSAYSTIGIATSSDMGYTWNKVWEKSYSETGQYRIEERIMTSDLGYEDVLFCIYFDGTSINFKNWYFDDFVVKVQEDLAINLNSININERLGSGPLNVSFNVQNMGSTAITDIEATYQIDDQEPVTETFSVYMTTFESNNISFSKTETLLPGTYNITLNITKVNGWDIDGEHTYSLSKQFSVAIADTQRIPMIEHFSSSTCLPCVLINMLMHNLTENNPGKFTYVKYAVNWPGTGDPYYIPESYDRALYYGVSTAPLVFLDSEAQVSNQTAQPVTNSTLMARYNTPAFADIRGAFNVDGNTINLSADVMSFIDLNNVKTYISINEKTTTGNVGSNGETEFHHVIMKMLDEGEGLDTDITAGEYKRFEYSFDMSETNVEEMNDLEVAVWLQDPETKEIFNSHFLYEYTDHPYPVEDLKFTLGNRLKISWQAPENATPTGYDLYVNNSLMLSNTTETSFSVDAADFCLAEVVAHYGDKTSVSAVKIYSSQFAIPENLVATSNVGNISTSWNAAEGATSYRLYRDGKLIAETESTEYIDNEIEEGAEYCYQVSAVYDNYESAASEEVCVTYVGVEELESRISISPNPARDYIKLSANSYQLSAVRVYNYLGILVEEIEVNSSDIEINVSDYSNGVYFIEIQTENGNVVKKIVKN